MTYSSSGPWRARLALVCLSFAILLLPAGSLNAAKRPANAYPPPSWILGPMQGWSGNDANLLEILDYYKAHNIPLTTIHFDFSRWENCNNNGQFTFGNALLDRLRADNLRAIFWIVPLIDQRCEEYDTGASEGYFVLDSNGQPIVTSWWEGTGSWIDFNNPDAVAWWHSMLDSVVTQAQGVIGGFYIDELRPDLTYDRAYGNSFSIDLLTYTRAKIPDGEVVLKNYGKNTPDIAALRIYAHTAYVNDLAGDFAGLQAGIWRVFDTLATTGMPIPYNEYTGYSLDVWPPDDETMIRRLHWGALQGVMENDPANPNPTLIVGQSAQVLQAQQYYWTLHWELVPYLHSYDRAAYETGAPVFRQPDSTQYSTRLGDNLFVQYVTDYVRTVNVTLPAGEWVNYWDESQVFTGPATISYAVPLGREPIFMANGSLLPMQVRDASTGHGTTASAGALTVNVLPDHDAIFPFYDDRQGWITLESHRQGTALTLCTRAALSQPLIYRVLRWSAAPQQVTALNGAVGVNATWGYALPGLTSEQAAEASNGGWFYDAAARHLIVKLTQLGAGCGTPASLFIPLLLR